MYRKRSPLPPSVPESTVAGSTQIYQACQQLPLSFNALVQAFLCTERGFLITPVYWQAQWQVVLRHTKHANSYLHHLMP
jgi:hypothetical protein